MLTAAWRVWVDADTGIVSADYLTVWWDLSSYVSILVRRDCVGDNMAVAVKWGLGN